MNFLKGFLKIVMTIFNDDDDLETDKKSAKNYTSGKSVIPLATCPDVKETYENLRILLELIELKKLEPYKITGDLKVLNILGN